MAANPSPAAEFKDFDDNTNFHQFKDAVASPESQNFVLDFSRQKAVCAFDLTPEAIEQALVDRDTAEVSVTSRQILALRFFLISKSHSSGLAPDGCG